MSKKDIFKSSTKTIMYIALLLGGETKKDALRTLKEKFKKEA